VFHWTCIPTGRPGQTMTDMFYPVDPEGLFNAIQKMSEAGKPLYITGE
jgi:beta-glucosidase